MRTRICLMLFTLALLFSSCKKNDGALSDDPKDRLSLDNSAVEPFFSKYPEFKPYQSQVAALYKQHNNQLVWYDKDGRVDFAEVLFSKTQQMENEGVPIALPYAKEFAALIEKRDTKKPTSQDDLLLSSMYFFYSTKVVTGIDAKKSRQTGWFLPRENMSLINYLDTLVKEPELIDTEKENVSQYYNLREALKHYREIEKNGGWSRIDFPQGKKSIKPGESDPIIAQVRKRLAISGELKTASDNPVYDDELQAAILAFEGKTEQTHITGDKNISEAVVKQLNVPVSERIKTIIVNMERCRWLSTDFENQQEYIGVNIPSYSMRYVRDGKTALESNVVVGKEMNKTVVFSGKMSYMVFSPYWNIPKSIISKEIKPAMEKDKNYLEKHNMEWNGGNIRQKPGLQNSLGLVKFMFPNNNNIYLHDSPAKSLYDKDDRALSHGCVRVQKAKELTNLILKDDKNWNAQKIDAAMNSGKEKYHTLNRKIPVYIAYFTAWADKDGKVVFYEDIYKRDQKLASLLYKN